VRKATIQRLLLVALAGAAASACATSSGDRATPARPADRNLAPTHRDRVAQTALEMVGKPYRWGGSSPQGFDCSGLVLYSYRAAGITGLPRSAHRLKAAAAPLEMSEVEPGDLLFFELSGAKSSHVAIYVGKRHFVHAPSSGKSVEKVSFDHAYWGRQLERASAGRVPH
jgi:cell wall-associated NlpC family hydrolase